MKTFRFLLIIALLLCANFSISQTLRGRIITPASPTTNPMDPNGDGFVTKTTTGFSNDGDYIGEFELPMFGIPKVANGEVDGDNVGNPCGITDLIPDKNGFSVYAFRDANNNLICRFRVGDNNPSVEAWTLLLDVDGLFGPGKDPNATADNPGFELDITLIKRNNAGILVYNIDGTDKCGSSIANFPIATNFQISLADEVSCGDPDYFYDFYVPFPAVAAAFNASSGSNISASTGLRYVAVTNTSATCAMDGKIADISGVDNDDPLYNNCDVCAFTAIIESQCPTAVNDLCSTCLGFNSSLPAKPTINEPIRAGQTIITGTSGAGTFLLLSVYQRIGGTDATPIWGTTPREQKVVSVPVSAWSITLSSPLMAYDKIEAKSQLTIDGSGCDSSNGNTTSTSVTVVEPNVAPVAQDQAVTVIEDTPKTIMLGATDADGNPLTYVVVTQPANGTLTGTAPNLIYTPNPNYNGPDSFTFRASDGVLNSNTATVTITVTPVNDAPAANNQSVTTPEDTPKLITLTASDIENNALTYSIVSLPAHGTLSGSGANITYTPSSNYFGSDSFTFKANDGLDSNIATVTITVTPVNDPPVASNVSVTTPEDVSVIVPLAGTDIENNTLIYTIVTQPSFGTLSGGGANPRYIPNANYNGPDSFTYKVNDGTSDSNIATVSITVTPVNDAPTAISQTITTPEDTPVGITLTATHPDAGAIVTFSIVTPPQFGTLTGTLPNLTYTPNANFNGQDRFTFKANDGVDDSNIATVIINVTPVSDSPIASNLTVTTNEDTPVSFTISGTDPDGSAVTYTILTQPANGTLSGTAPNLTFSPATNFNGSTTFTFKVNDGTSDSNTATVTINVTPVNDAPIAENQTYTIAEDAVLSITLVGSDVDGDPLTYIIVTQPQHATLGGSGANLTYPANGYVGPDSFTYKVNDGNTDSNIATVFINVTPDQNPPVANSRSIATNEDTPATIILTGFDPHGEPITFTLLTNPSHGTLIGTIPNYTYIPDLNYFGPDSFTFKVNDGTLDSNIGTILITVNPVNDAPIANSQSVLVIEDTPKAITLTGSDIESDPLTFSIIAQPSNGTLSGSGANVTYTPNINYSGSDSFTFRVNDGSLNSNVATVSITVTAVNDSPVASNQTVITNEDEAVSFTIVGSDPEGSAITYVVVSGPSNGTLSGTAPNFTYSPNANFNGTDSFTYKVNDGSSDSNVATVSITVNPINDAPVANNQSVTTPEDTPVSITLTGSDIDGNTLTYSVVTPPQFGTLSGTVPNLTYTPNANYFGSDSFTFRVNDGTINSSVATVSITVTSVNDAPVASNITVTTSEDTPVGVTLIGTDVEGNSLTYIIVSGPSNGILTGTGPNRTYTPNANFNGTDSFTYKVNDGTSDSNTATVTITVTPVNDAPVVSNMTVSYDLNTPVNFTLNAFDADGNTLTYTIITTPANGTLSGTAPNLTYTPDSGFNLTNTMTFKVNDGTVDSNIATVTFVFNNLVNDPPVAEDQTVIVIEDQNKNITLTATDPDPGDVLTFTIVTPPSNGTLSGTAPNLTYTPAANYTGPDSFTFKASDGTLDSNIGTISITVTPVNDAPVANAQTVSVLEDNTLNITLTGTDVDNASLVYSVITQPTNGVLSGLAPNLVYTPNANYNGPDSFTFTVSDGSLISSAATISITVIPVNDAPVADSQSVTTNEDTPAAITLTGSDIDLDALTFTIVTPPVNGTLSGSGSNVTYTPAANYNGPDSFTFKVNDGTTDSNTATVSITVTPVNDAPIANNQSVTTNEDTPAAITLTGSDVDLDALTYTIITPPANGTLSGTVPNVTYSPNANYHGSDSFTFKVNDGTTDSNTATVSITVTPVNDAPIANSQSVTTNEDTPASITLTGSDIDLDVLTFMIVTPPVNGTLSGSGSNVTYTPAANYNGPDSFTFKVNDGTTDSNTATVSITVTPVNDAPIANNQSVSVIEDTAKSITLTGSDVDGSALTFTVLTQPTRGILTGSGANRIYTPNPNYNGPDSFTFKVNDGTTNSNTATVSIMVTPVNDAPVASNKSVTTNEDTPVLINLSATDIDGDALIYSVVTAPLHGTLSCNNCANPTYTPALNYNGPDSFTFRVNDGTTNSNVATVSISVSPLNDRPIADNQTVTVQEDVAKSFVITGSDVEGSALTFTILTQPTSGVLSGTAPNLVYTPNLNFNGLDSFTFTVSDGQNNAVNPATVLLVVVPVNDVPVATNQTITTPEDVSILVNLSATDPDGDVFTYSVVTAPQHGALSCSNCANPTYVPALNYNGPDSFTFKANDGTDDSNLATINITVTPVNDAPIANSQSVTVIEDVAKDITLTGNDEEGSVLTFTIVTPPAHGAVIINGAIVTYTPSLNYNGQDSFTFKVNDGTTDSNPATVSITVTPVNDAPIANNDVKTTLEDLAVSFNITDNDTDVDGIINAASVDLNPSTPAEDKTFTVAGQGTYVVDNSGIVLFTPALNYNGTATPVSYTVKDNEGTLTNVATIQVIVTPVNDAPVVIPTTVTINEDETTSVCFTVTDVENDPAVFTGGVSLNGNGTLVLDPATGLFCFLYTPNPNFNGQDVVEVTVCDANNPTLCSTGVITINVALVNDPPIILVGGNPVDTVFASTPEDTPVNFCFDATDLEGDVISIGTITNTSGGGTVVNNSSAGNTFCFSFTPTSNFSGSSFWKVQVCDSGNPSLCREVTIEIEVIPIQDPPVAINQNVTVIEDTPKVIVLSATDPDASDVLTYTIISGPAKGTLAGTGANVTYTPNQNYNGPDSFTFKVNDGTDDSNVATVTIDVTPVNDAPVISPIPVLTVEEDGMIEICVGVTDIDGDGITYNLPTNVSGGGTMTLSTQFNFCFVFKPIKDFNGDSFWKFSVCDTGNPSLCTSVDVKIIVTPVNDAPVAVNDFITVQSFVKSDPINILDNDLDVENDELVLTITPLAGPYQGTVTMTAGGNIQYQSNIGFIGADSIRYKVCDVATPSLCDEGVVFIDVTPAPFKIYNGLSPNGDGKNDHWVIDGIETFPNNKVRVFDRYNNLIFETTGYNNSDNTWQGQTNHSLVKGNVSEGTYFYVLDLGDGSGLYSGYVVLKKD